MLRYLGYIPSGILLTVFSLSAIKKFPAFNHVKFGCVGLAIFYGIATIIVGIFPCDKSCNKELVDPSISQLIHNVTGLLTYLFVPLSILAIGVGLHKLKTQSKLSNIAILCRLNCIAFVV